MALANGWGNSLKRGRYRQPGHTATSHKNTDGSTIPLPQFGRGIGYSEMLSRPVEKMVGRRRLEVGHADGLLVGGEEAVYLLDPRRL